MSYKFEPSPAVLIVPEAMVPLALHNSRTFLIDKPSIGKESISVSVLGSRTFYPPNSEAELSVDSTGISRVQEN